MSCPLALVHAFFACMPLQNESSSACVSLLVVIDNYLRFKSLPFLSKNMKIYSALFIALVAANNGLASDVSATNVASADRSHRHLRALTDVSSQNATDSGSSTDSVCDVDPTNNRAGAICKNNNDCLSGMCISGAGQDCSICCGNHPWGTCDANGNGCNAVIGGSCGGQDHPFKVANNTIPGCYNCVYNQNEERMDIDTHSLRASILEDE